MFLTERDEQDIPCDTCSLVKECETKKLECVAIRNWYYKGKYQTKDMGRLRRAMKSVV